MNSIASRFDRFTTSFSSQPSKQRAPSAADEIEMQCIGHTSDPGPDDVVPDTFTDTAPASTGPTHEASVTRIVPPATVEVLNKLQVRALLEKIESGLIQATAINGQIRLLLKELTLELETLTDDRITFKSWRSVSLKLDQLSLLLNTTSWAVRPGKPGCISLDFIKLNIQYLASSAKLAWAQHSYDALNDMFALEIERKAVSNPALNDTATTHLSLEVMAPQLPFLSAGGELNLQHMVAIDDEGNFVTTNTASGGLTFKFTALIASFRARAVLGGGPFSYGRTAHDQTRHFFKELIRTNKNNPQVAPYLSRSLAGGVAGAGVDEISGFEAQRDAFLLQQKQISKTFSVFLSLSAESVQPQNCSPAQIALQASSAKPINFIQGTVFTKTATAAGNVDVLLFSTGLTGELNYKTTKFSRSATLCDLYRNVLIDEGFKAKLQQDLARASATAHENVMSFWYGPLADTDDYALETHVANLKKDFKWYTKWHGRRAQGDASIDTMLTNFHHKYGVRTPEQCLCNMALLTAHWYGLARAQNSAERVLALATDLQKLDEELHSSAIPNARAYLAKHACATRQIEYVSSEKSGLYTEGSLIGVSKGIKISSRSVNHYNPFRSGDTITVEFTLGKNASVNQKLLKSICSHFQGGLSGISNYFGTGSYTEAGVYVVKFFKSAVITGQPFRKFYDRCVAQRTVQVGVEDVLIPVTGMITLKAGLIHTDISNKFVGERLATESMLYFGVHYMHTLTSGKTDKDGVKKRDSYWYRLEREHQATLEKLFLQYAEVSATNGGLMQELAGIDRAFLNLANNASAKEKEELRTCMISKAAFISSVQALEAQRTSAHYETALLNFKAMLRTYYPAWFRKRETSNAYKSWQYQLN